MDSAYSKYQENLHEQFRKSNAQQQKIIEEQNKIQSFLNKPISNRLEGYHTNWNLLWNVIDEVNKKGYSIVINSTHVSYHSVGGTHSSFRFEVEDTSIRNNDYISTEITKRMVYQSLLQMISIIDVPEWDEVLSLPIAEEVRPITRSCKKCGRDVVMCYCEMD